MTHLLHLHLLYLFIYASSPRQRLGRTPPTNSMLSARPQSAQRVRHCCGQPQSCTNGVLQKYYVLTSWGPPPMYFHLGGGVPPPLFSSETLPLHICLTNILPSQTNSLSRQTAMPCRESCKKVKTSELVSLPTLDRTGDTRRKELLTVTIRRSTTELLGGFLFMGISMCLMSCSPRARLGLSERKCLTRRCAADDGASHAHSCQRRAEPVLGLHTLAGAHRRRRRGPQYLDTSHHLQLHVESGLFIGSELPLRTKLIYEE